MTYGSPVWISCSRTHSKRLQILQNKCLKIIYNLPMRYSTRQFHEETKYPMIEDFLTKLNEKFKATCLNSPNPLTREFVFD